MIPARILATASLTLALTLAPGIAAAAPPATVTLDLGGGVSLDLVLIPRGTFTQGSPPTEKDRKDDERPRKVTLTSDFYLGRFPVTRGQFTRFTAATGYRTEAEKGASGGSGFDGRDLVQRKEFTWKSPGFPQDDTHPVTLVTWDDARAFDEWLSRISGREIRLPTEAEWEHAYRAGGTSAYHDGSDPLALGWFKENAGKGTHPVGQKKANRFGLSDMAGNVFEWCGDWYARYGEGPATDPLQTVADTEDKARRVLRGGSWFKEARNGRAAARSRNTPGSRNADNGFRIAAGLIANAVPMPAQPVQPAQPGSPAIPSSPPSESRSGDDSAARGVLFGGSCCGGVGLLGLIAWLVTRGGGTRGISFLPRNDGFWILAPPKLIGQTLNYRYVAGGMPQIGNVRLEPAKTGQFVYTGAAPTRIQAVNLVSSTYTPPQAGYRAGGFGQSGPGRHEPTRREQPWQEPIRNDDPPFGGFPPAY